MANSPLTLAQSRVLAKKLSDSLGNVAAEEAPKKFVTDAFVRILCREPTGEELTACIEFLAEQSKRLADATSLSAFAAGAAASVEGESAGVDEEALQPSRAPLPSNALPPSKAPNQPVN